MARARGADQATILDDGRGLVAGGCCIINGGASLNSAELYEPGAGRWTTTASMASGRFGHSLTLLANGTLLVAGGVDNSVTLSSAELYSPTTRRWIRAAAMATGRLDFSATLLTNGQVPAGRSPMNFGDYVKPQRLPVENPAAGSGGSLNRWRPRPQHCQQEKY
jgi:Kelch motif